MNVMRAFISVVAALVLLLAAGRASAAYVPPPRTGFVTDPAKALAPEAAEKISAKLGAYQQCSTNEIAVFIPKSLDGSTIEDAAYVTFNTWKLGLAAKDNGVLLLIAPAERKAFIATGKGVGGELPDIAAFHILRDHVTPNMAKGRVFAAVDEGTSEIGKALGGCAMNAAIPPPPPTSPTVLVIARSAYGAGIFLLAFALFTALRGRTGPKLLLGALLTGLYEGVAFKWDPLDTGLLFVVLLLFANAFFWLRRAPRGSGGGGSGSSAPWDSGGSYGGGSSSSSSSSGGGGSTGGGGAGDSW